MVIERPLYRLFPKQEAAMRLLGFTVPTVPTVPTLPDEPEPPVVVEEMLYGGEAGGGKVCWSVRSPSP